MEFNFVGSSSELQEYRSPQSSFSARLSPLETLLEEDSGDDRFFEASQHPLHGADRHSSKHPPTSNGRLSYLAPVHAGATEFFE